MWAQEPITNIHRQSHLLRILDYHAKFKHVHSILRNQVLNRHLLRLFKSKIQAQLIPSKLVLSLTLQCLNQ